MDKQKSSKGIIVGIVITVLVLIIVALVGTIAYMLGSGMLRFTGDQAESSVETTAEATDEEVIDEEATATVTETAATPDATDTKEIIDSVAAEETRNRPKEWYGSLTGNREPDRVINLKEYTDRNTDVYAWIEIPGTDIDYPIAYCDDAVDPFWFTHDIDGNPSESGMIITDSMNAVDLSDPETLIYGQSPDDGTMFAQLSRFKDDDFFGKHDTVNIYINDAELVYRIYACYTGSNEHILINHDFTDPIQFMRFFDSIEEVRDLSKNIRQEAKPMIGDHAIALVTHCGDDSKRLFVHAKLTEVRY